MIDFIIVSDKPVKLNTYTDYTQIRVPFEGYNFSLNTGAAFGNSEWIAFCNDDLIFNPNWFREFYKHKDDYESVSGWCPKTHRQWWGNKRPSKPVESYEVGKVMTGWFILMRRDAYNRLEWSGGNGFDEHLEFWCCDNAAAEQMKAANVKHALLPSMEITHLQSQTLNKQPRDVYENLTKRQVKKFNRLYNKNLFGLGC